MTLSPFFAQKVSPNDSVLVALLDELSDVKKRVFSFKRFQIFRFTLYKRTAPAIDNKTISNY